MIIINNKEIRDTVEQVHKNKDDIEELKNTGKAEYSAGTGIDIADGVISVDEDVAMKTDLDYDNLSNKPNLNVYAKKDDAKQNITAASMTIKDPYMGAISTTYNSAYISMKGLGHDYTYTLPNKSGTFAMTSDIPTVDAYTKAESDAKFQTKIGMELYATQQQLNLNIAATEARTDSLLANKQDKLTAGTGIDITNNEVSIDSTVALKTDIPNYTGGSGITINSGNEISADSTLARVADIPSITGLTMYNYKITISGLDGRSSNTRSAVYIVSLPYQWDYSSLTKYDIIRKIPVWSVVVDTDVMAGNKNMGRFHWQTGTVAQVDWVDGTFTYFDFVGGFDAKIEPAAPEHF